MARARSGEYLSVTAKAFRTAVKADALPAEFDCIHPFVRAKDFDSTRDFANYQYDYRLDGTGGGMPTGTAYRRVAAQLVRCGAEEGCSQQRNVILSRNARVNTEMCAAVRAVVLTMERMKRGRVLRLTAEFVLDELDDLWLVSVTHCTVASILVTSAGSPQVPRTSSSLDRQDARIPVASYSPRSEDTSTMLATEVRSRNRQAEEKASVPDDAEFSKLLQKVGYVSPIRRQASSQSPQRRLKSVKSSTGEHDTSVVLPPRVEVPCSVPPQRETVDGSSSRASASCFSWGSEDDSGGEASNGGPGNDYDTTANKLDSPIPHAIRNTVFASAGVGLDQKATNGIYGSSQVRGAVE